MIKIVVWYWDEQYKENCRVELRNLKPRRYMMGWDKERLFKYIEEELYWNDIKPESVTCIEFKNEKEQWLDVVWQKKEN